MCCVSCYFTLVVLVAVFMGLYLHLVLCVGPVASTMAVSTAQPAVTSEQAITVGSVSTAQPIISTVMSSQVSDGHDDQAQAAADCSGRRFDGASFIGGIVLCGGLALIGVFIYKYYQSRVEARYHQF